MVGAIERRYSRVSLEALLFGVVVAYVLAGWVAYAIVGDATYAERLVEPRLWIGASYMTPFALAVVLFVYRLRVRNRASETTTRAGDGGAAAWEAARSGALSARRLRYALVVTMAAPIFFNAFAAWKSLIPAMNPFWADFALAQVDGFVHGGLPHRWLAGLPLVALDRIYYFAWFELLLTALAVMAWRAETRMLLAFAVCWIVLGTVVATIVSSAGPPYYLALTGDDRYADLFSRLAATDARTPLVTLRVQRALWGAYSTRTILAAGGISAFPSMHVAVPSLLAFATWRRSRRLALTMAMVALVILISSVALGWHYAVDGYAGVAAAAVVWYAIRRLPAESAMAAR